MGFPGGAAVKDPPANPGDARGTGLTLAREDPLEKEMAASPVFLPGKSHRPRSLAGYSPWGHKESDTAECTHTHTHTLSKAWTRAVRPVSHFIHMSRSPRSLSIPRFNLHTLSRMELSYLLTAEVCPRCTAGLAHTHSVRALPASATHHSTCVNVQIIPWNQRNLLKGFQ